MSSSTTSVEFDTALLERLRERAPGKTDRELLEDLIQAELRRQASGQPPSSLIGAFRSGRGDLSERASRDPKP